MQWRWPVPLTAFLILVVVTPLHAQAPARTPSEAAAPIEADRKSTRLNSSHSELTRMPSSA